VTHSELLELQAKASTVIDSSWHYAWHWEKTRDSGTLTAAGWEKALSDGCKLKAELQLRVQELEEILPKVAAAAAQLRDHEAPARRPR
jgi:hypothetical protein